MGVVNTVTCSLNFTYLLILNSNNLPLNIHICLRYMYVNSVVTSVVQKIDQDSISH